MIFEPLNRSTKAQTIVATISVAIVFVILSGAIATGLLWSLLPAPTPAQKPPVLHVFNADLSINSPHPITTPTDLDAWLRQVSTIHAP